MGSKFIIDGKEYERLEDVPEPYRSLIAKAEAVAGGEAAKAAEAFPGAKISINENVVVRTHRKSGEPAKSPPPARLSSSSPSPVQPASSSPLLLIAAFAGLLGWIAYHLAHR